MFRKENLWNIAGVLSLVGVCLAIYLFYNFLTKPAVESCYLNSTINCDAVTKGSLSTLFGIPVSLVGLLGYIAIFFSALFKLKKLLLGVTTFGMIFCLYLTSQEVFVLKVICPVCITCQIVMFFVFLCGLTLHFGRKK